MYGDPQLAPDPPSGPGFCDDCHMRRDADHACACDTDIFAADVIYGAASERD